MSPVVLTPEMAKRIVERAELFEDERLALQAIETGDVRLAVRCEFCCRTNIVPPEACAGCHGTGWRLA